MRRGGALLALLALSTASCAGASDDKAPADAGKSPLAEAHPSSTAAQPATGSYGAPLSARTWPARVADDVADGHPRLWIREADLPRLRAWARPGNVVWENGVAARLTDARARADAGGFEKATDCANTEPYCESFAALFAFGSLVDPDPAARAKDAQRGKKLLVGILERIDKRTGNDGLTDPRLSVYNRSRWAGEAFALAVDWLYPHLSAADRALVRRVFLRWAEEQLVATSTDYNHPVPAGVVADPRLLANVRGRRYALNNYYAAHTRNLGLMALALDPEDDPEEPAAGRASPSLRGYLGNAIGAWWYVADRVLRDEARGGISPEGAQYGFQTLGYYAQLALALRTAGKTDPSLFPPGSPPVDLGDNPFWSDVLPATLHLVTPGLGGRDERGGATHQAASWGDDQRFAIGDGLDLWVPWGLEGALRGDGARLEAARWVIRNLPSPDEAAYLRRVRGDDYPRASILHFMITDPDGPPARDPRASMPLAHRADGLGWVLARTGWDPGASFFGAHAGWIHIDHQHGDGGDFFLYRKGEFLTKERAGWGTHFEQTDLHNALAIENTRPSRGGERREMVHTRGSQWALSPSGDPRPLGVRTDRDLVHAAWDLTPVYNSSYEEVTEVEHASRSLTWLVPDAVVVVDRARTASDGRFRRVFFQLPAPAAVQGAVATARTPRGQTLRIETMLPAGPTLTSGAITEKDPERRSPEAEPMKAFLRVEPAGPPPRSTTFIHVLTAADAGQKAMEPRRVAVEGTAFAGVEVGPIAVLAPLAEPVTDPAEIVWTTSAARSLVTGLTPKSRYVVGCSGAPAARRCSAKKAASGSVVVDDAGTLDVRDGGSAR